MVSKPGIEPGRPKARVLSASRLPVPPLRRSWIGARGRIRTFMTTMDRRILSAVRLPISPLEHWCSHFHGVELAWRMCLPVHRAGVEPAISSASGRRLTGWPTVRCAASGNRTLRGVLIRRPSSTRASRCEMSGARGSTRTNTEPFLRWPPLPLGYARSTGPGGYFRSRRPALSPRGEWIRVRDSNARSLGSKPRALPLDEPGTVAARGVEPRLGAL